MRFKLTIDVDTIDVFFLLYGKINSGQIEIQRPSSNPIRTISRYFNEIPCDVATRLDNWASETGKIKRYKHTRRGRRGSGGGERSRWTPSPSFPRLIPCCVIHWFGRATGCNLLPVSSPLSFSSPSSTTVRAPLSIFSKSPFHGW